MPSPELQKTAIRKALDAVDWDFIYLNKTVHDQALSFDRVLMNIFTDDDLYNRYNYFGDQDPPWMNDRIKLKNSFKHTLLLFYKQSIFDPRPKNCLAIVS